MKTKRIGIITFLNANNYGAELQAYALNRKLELLGYDSEIINYLFYKNPDYIAEEKAKPLIPLSLKTRVKDLILKYIDKLSILLNPTIAETRRKRFKEFHAVHTKTSKVYTRYSELYLASHLYDVYIVGSDQVWNPNNSANLEPYFLTFAPAGSKKLSYASSFGVSKIDTKHHAFYQKMLTNLDYVSTREEVGVKLIREMSNREATHVVDPTLLLQTSDWENILVPYNESEPFILIFVFRNSKFITDFALQLRKVTGYKIIRICPNEMKVDSNLDILNLRDLGPLEFLGVYQRASIVLTTSFHGTIFSLIFEKPFYTITPAGKNNNSRQQGLLSLVGLSDRIIEEGSNYPDITRTEIDFKPVKEILERERENSVKYLMNSIEN
ncbi:polysaccharide pyruvyl transferase family protein [Dyadobacter sp.]|uniref:polysaccharide pyruvyl transferase family protein n=1 Tax=Dyadobacter sp. TaxID=1914288 RepID=UPI003F6E6F4B